MFKIKICFKCVCPVVHIITNDNVSKIEKYENKIYSAFAYSAPFYAKQHFKLKSWRVLRLIVSTGPGFASSYDICCSVVMLLIKNIFHYDKVKASV